MTHETHARIAALVAAGFLMTSGGAAFADTATSGNGSIGGGNQLGADIDAPINLCGNAIGLLGVAGAQCTDSEASVEEPGEPESPEDPGKEPPEEPESPEEPEDPGQPEDPQDPGTEPPEEPGEPEDPEHPESPEEPGAQPPEDEGEEPGEQPSEGEDRGEEPGHVPDEISAPSEPSPSPVAADLAQTGTERGPLVGLIAAAVGALAVGAGLVFGLRRRAGA